ncbi:hypothetical protein [Streptomyces sp. NPDC059008]|uniref:hypothetical protein n=1 Tax=Streptomyces sp. NPDC059008 TaxID=3346693 RepID=UPI003697C73E
MARKSRSVYAVKWLAVPAIVLAMLGGSGYSTATAFAASLATCDDLKEMETTEDGITGEQLAEMCESIDQAEKDRDIANLTPDEFRAKVKEAFSPAPTPPDE